MKKSEVDTLLNYMQAHFMELEELVKMGLAQNLINELKAGTDEFPISNSVKMVLQVGGKEWDVYDCRGLVIADYVSDGHVASDIKRLAIYLKPEDGKAYYVVNDEYHSSVSLSDQNHTANAGYSK